MRIGSLLQYFCSSCGKILKENTTIEVQRHQLNEECPGCGALLIDSLQNRRKVSLSLLEQGQVSTSSANKPSRDLSVDFNTAYRQIEDTSIKLAFDIDKLDSVLNLNAHGSLCLIGEQKYTQLLIDRLCVHSLLPKRYGGIAGPPSKIIVIDAGNCADVHQFVDFARQYGLEVKKVLQSLVVSRVFTIYQFTHLVVYELPEMIQRFSSRNKIIVIYGLLHLFVSDPHIDKADAKKLTKEITSSIRKLSEDRLVLVSFSHCNSEYEKSLLPVFDNTIEVTNDVDNSRGLLIGIKRGNSAVKRRELCLKGPTRLNKHELLLAPLR